MGEEQPPDDICNWYKTSRKQRKTEQERGEGNSGTIGYTKMGCYVCDGKNKDCESYHRH